MKADPCDLSATEIAHAVRQRTLSPVTVLNAHLDRISKLDPDLNAFATLRTRQALVEAKALASSPDRSSLPLAGVTVAIQDNISVQGEPSRAGSSATPATPAASDDLLVARLRSAGAIIIGKARMPELAAWPLSVSKAFGATRNPWDRTHTPGGSTSGGAVAVATGMAALALGADGEGSLRVAAACCSILGLKPSSPTLPLPANSWSGLAQHGPLARTVSDLALALDVLSAQRSPHRAEPPVRPLRIVVSTRLPSAGGKPDDATATAIDRTVALLEQAGHRLVHEDPPYPRDLALRFARRWLPGLAESASGLNLDELEPRTRSMVQIGHLLDRLRLASQHDETFTRTMLDWFSSRDLLLTPTLAFPPPPLGQWQSGGWLQTALSVNRWLCTVPWNLVDFPALSLPAGLSKDGLPIGLQLVAPPGGERLLLSLARQLELLQPSPRLPAR